MVLLIHCSRGLGQSKKQLRILVIMDETTYNSFNLSMCILHDERDQERPAERTELDSKPKLIKITQCMS